MSDSDERGALGLERRPTLVFQREELNLVNTIRWAITDYIRTDPEAEKIKKKLQLNTNIKSNQTVRTGLTSGGGLSFTDVLIWYIYYANEYSEGAADVALEEYYQGNTFEALMCLWVCGITVEEKADLGDGYLICPLEELPISVDRERFRTEIGDIGFDQPACAIVATIRVDKSHQSDGEPHIKTYDRLHEICRLLSLINGVTCSPMMQSLYPLNCPISFLGGGGKIYLRQPMLMPIVNLSSANISELKNLMIAIQTLDSSTRSLLNRSVGRLQKAKHGDFLGDQFLDLSIALEMLLLNDNSSHVQLALSFRLHGALLMGDDLSSRMRIQDMLSDIYTQRSSMAHAGTMTNRKKCKYSKKSDKAWEILIEEFLTLGEDIIKKIIINGLPKWGELRLGGATDEENLNEA